MGRDGETIAHYYCILMAEDLPAKAFQEDYRALLHLLEALDGFVLVYVFAESTLARNEVRARLSDSLRLRAIGLDVAADADGEALLAKLWRGIESTAAGKVPLWVECDLPGEDWDRVRGFMLGRLNEARHRLETAFSRPLFLLLPAAWKHAAARAAPDLWSVRKWVLEAPNAIIETTQRIPSRTRDDTRVSHVDRKVSPRLAEMRREWRNMLNSPPAEIASLVPGWLLVDELIESDGAAALDIAAQVRALAQRRVEAADLSLRRSFLRDWSISWNKEGDASYALGRVEEALAAYRESKALRERIVKEFGENRQALRDWSESWSRVGNATYALGRVEEALAAYRESKALCERIVKEFGENREALRDWSVSWEKVGDATNALGRVEEALAAYRESKALRERIVKEFGENRQALRDWSISWERVGDATNALGRVEEALAAYREGKALCERIVSEFGENREALRDWSISWEKVGDATYALRRVEDALAAYREGKALCERIVSEFGKNREALRDCSESWSKVGDAANALGRIADALAAYREGKALREREITEYGENPHSIEEVVSMSIKSLDADANSLSQTEHAELRQKILRLARAFPDRPQYHAWSARFGLDTASPLP